LQCEVETKVIRKEPGGLEGDKLRLFCPACGETYRLDLSPYGVFSWNGRLFRWDDVSPGRHRIDVPPRMRLKLPPDELEVIDVQSICYDAVPIFRLANGALSYPRWPVRKEYLDFIDFQKVSEVEITRDNRYVARLPFKGSVVPREINLPCIPVNPERPPIHENATFPGIHLVMWPDVPYKAWKRYFLRFGGDAEAAAPVFDPARELKVFALASPELGTAQAEWVAVDALGSDGRTRFGCMESRPSRVAIEFGSRGGGIWEIPEPPYDSYPEGINTNIAVDFGTSNTCIATGEEDRQEFIPITPCDLFVIRGSELPERMSFADTWPPRQGFGKNKALLPTELLTRERMEEVRMQAGRLKQWRPVVDYGIPSGGSQVEFNEDEHIIAEFKWDQRIQDGVLRGYAQELQKRYIEFVMLFALAQLAHARRLGARVDTRFSFPLAFDPDQRKSFENVLQEVTGAVGTMTGLNVSVNTPLVDEARAAASAIVPFGKACLYVDIGGGSSDIALDIIRLESNQERPRYKYVASFQYAGGALVDAYAGGRCLSVSVNTFRRLIREKDVRKLINDGRAFEHKPEKINAKTYYFYAYLQEFLARLLAAHIVSGEWKESLGEADQEQVRQDGYPIELYPLGNGWGFGHLFDPLYAKEVFSRDLTRHTNEILGEAEQQEPSAGVLPRVRVNVPEGFTNEDPKSAVVFGLLRGGSERDKRKDEGWVFRTVVGCTTRVGPTRVVPWHRPVTNLASREPEGEKEGLPIASLTCPPNEWPSFQRDLPTPHDLDPGLNRVGNDLAKCIRVGNKWLSQSPFHVLLEKLIRPKLKELL
jgi:hypothetical protein